jgi:hypothetical protein
MSLTANMYFLSLFVGLVTLVAIARLPIFEGKCGAVRQSLFECGLFELYTSRLEGRQSAPFLNETAREHKRLINL